MVQVQLILDFRCKELQMQLCALVYWSSKITRFTFNKMNYKVIDVVLCSKIHMSVLINALNVFSGYFIFCLGSLIFWTPLKETFPPRSGRILGNLVSIQSFIDRFRRLAALILRDLRYLSNSSMKVEIWKKDLFSYFF